MTTAPIVGNTREDVAITTTTIPTTGAGTTEMVEGMADTVDETITDEDIREEQCLPRWRKNGTEDAPTMIDRR